MIRTPTIGEAARRRRNTKLAGLSARGVIASLDWGEAIALVCECRRASCGARVSLPKALFHGLVGADGFWLVASGHVGADEHVVASSAGYQLTVRRSYVFELEPAPAD